MVSLCHSVIVSLWYCDIIQYNNLPTKVKEASSRLSFKIQTWNHLRLT